MRHLLGLALGIALGAQPALPQNSATIAGRIVSKTSKAAVAGADIELAPGARRLVSDDAGRFRFDQVPPGNVTLYVRRIGFVPESVYVTLGPREDFDVFIELEQAAQSLDTVNVAAAENPLARGKLSGFYERKKFGIGRFIDADILEKQQNRQLGELIASRTPGTRLVRARASSAAWIATTRHASIRGTLLDPSDAARGADRRACYPDVYFDGALVYSYGKGMPLFDMNLITTNVVAAVEVYVGPSQTPTQYAKVGSVCGVVLIWTK